MFGTDPTVISAWLPSTQRPSVILTTTPSVTTGHRLGAGILDERDAALGEHLLEHGGRVGVLVRQDLVAAGDHGHVDAEFGVGVDELRARHAGADHDEVVGQVGEVVELAPGQNPLAVRTGVGQHAGTGARRDQHDVGVEHLLGAVGLGDLDPVLGHAWYRVDEFAATADQRDALAAQPLGDVSRLRGGKPLHPVVDLRQRDLGVLDVDVEPELRRAAQVGAHARRRDESLGRHAVEQHACPADAVGVDDGDLGWMLFAQALIAGRMRGGHQRRLVAGRPSPDDHDAGCHRVNRSDARS